jgi:hypothetical protein
MRIDSLAPVPSTRIVAPTHDPAGPGVNFTKILRAAFLNLYFKFQHIGAKAACKMLLKLTLGLSNLTPIFNKYNEVCSVEIIPSSE